MDMWCSALACCQFSPAFTSLALSWRPGKASDSIRPGVLAPVSHSDCSFIQHRTEYDVQYPNLYAVPKLHKDADAFNRVQRGHQVRAELAYGDFLSDV